MMKSCIGFIGLLACGNCNNHIASGRTGPIKAFHCKSRANHYPVISIRGGSSDPTTSTQLNLSAAATMSSLFAGSIGGAIGVGIAYPFDTLSTKAQVRSGKSDEKQGNLIQNIKTIWTNEGIHGFFEGVFVTMIGQAAIKSVQFAVNEITLLYLETNATIQSNLLKMAIAGTLA